MAKENMEVKGKKQNRKTVHHIVLREFVGEQTMQEAFEQLVERQTAERLKEWMEHSTENRIAG